MTRPSIGTLQWLAATHGAMRWDEKLSAIAQGVLLRYRLRAARSGSPVRHIDVSDILPPDSAITREARALCESVSAPWLVNHCLRAYYWARLLNGRAPVDDEALFVALLLHDLGLTEAYRLPPGDVRQCFTQPAVHVADTLAHKHGWDDVRATRTAQAIALHLNVLVSDRHGPEARLARLGSGLDVAGLFAAQVPSDQREAVLRLFPRLDIKSGLDAALKLELQQRPDSRIAFSCKALGFRKLVQRTEL